MVERSRELLNNAAVGPATSKSIETEINRIASLSLEDVRELWRSTFKKEVPKALTRDLLVWTLTWRIQEQAFGGHDRTTLKTLEAYAEGRPADAKKVRRLKSGTVLVREYQGERHTVTVTQDGFIWQEKTYASLTIIACTITGTNWNGPRFFGLREQGTRRPSSDPTSGSRANSSGAPIGTPKGAGAVTLPGKR